LATRQISAYFKSSFEGAPVAPRFAQRFEREIQLDLVAVFEAVRDRFRDVIYRHSYPLDLAVLDAFGEGLCQKNVRSASLNLS
jgi:hypothetical protein